MSDSRVPTLPTWNLTCGRGRRRRYFQAISLNNSFKICFIHFLVTAPMPPIYYNHPPMEVEEEDSGIFHLFFSLINSPDFSLPVNPPVVDIEMTQFPNPGANSANSERHHQSVPDQSSNPPGPSRNSPDHIPTYPELFLAASILLLHINFQLIWYL